MRLYYDLICSACSQATKIQPYQNSDMCADCRHNARRRQQRTEASMAIAPPSLPGEEWRPVVGYEGRYEVSSAGRVRSVRGARAGHVRTLSLNPKGYLRVELQGITGSKNLFVHRLVAQAFLPIQKSGDEVEVNHIDGDQGHNTPNNLEWTTRVGNARHARANGRYPLGEEHRRAKLTEVVVRAIRDSHGTMSTTALAARFGVSRTTVRDVITRRSWAHLE